MIKKGEWTFLTNHAHVFIYIARHSKSTAQEIAQEVGLSIRAVQLIINDLDKDGYVVRHREGRCNRYIVHPEMPMRHRLERDHAVGDILYALQYDANGRQTAVKEVISFPTKA